MTGVLFWSGSKQCRACEAPGQDLVLNIVLRKMSGYGFTWLICVLFACLLLTGCIETATGDAEAIEVTEETEAECTVREYPDTMVRLVSAEDISSVTESLEQVSPDELGVSVTFDDVSVPFAEDCCYLTVDGDFLPRDILSLSDGSHTIFVDGHFADDGLDSVMAQGRGTELYICDENRFSVVSLYFTNLPVITLDTGGRFVSREDKACSFSLFEARNGNENASLTVSESTLRIRGASSVNMPKKSMKLSLKKEDGTGNSVSLCGMRKDDDWILYAAYSDHTKVRDVVCCHLWEKMEQGREYAGSLKTQYVEVILNGKYNGFYVLMERFDGKTLGLDISRGDSLFKCISWDVPSSSDLSKLGRKKAFSSLELKYPENEDIPDGVWKSMSDFVGVCYETDGSTFIKQIKDIADMENQVDYWLFVNAVMGEDNTWKNTYYATIDGKVYAYPWDLDITLGESWNGNAANNYLYENMRAAGKTYDYQCGRRLIKYVDEASEYAVRRWNQLKEDGIITAEAIIDDAEKQWELLHSGGAWDRNLKRWPSISTTDSLDMFRNAVRTQFGFLDSYINSLE